MMRTLIFVLLLTSPVSAQSVRVRNTLPEPINFWVLKQPAVQSWLGPHYLARNDTILVLLDAPGRYRVGILDLHDRELVNTPVDLHKIYQEDSRAELSLDAVYAHETRTMEYRVRVWRFGRWIWERRTYEQSVRRRVGQQLTIRIRGKAIPLDQFMKE